MDKIKAFVKLFITYAPILISVFALYLSSKSYNISEAQFNLATAKALPMVTFSTRNAVNKFDESEEEELIIANIGEPANNFFSTVIEYIEFSGYKQKPGAIFNSKIKYKLIGYFDSTFSRHNKIGELIVHKGGKNKTNLDNLTKELTQAVKQYQLVLRCNKFCYILVQYVDIQGRNHQQYFFVDNIYGAQLLDNEYGKEVFRKHNAQDGYSGTISLRSKIDTQELAKTINAQFTN